MFTLNLFSKSLFIFGLNQKFNECHIDTLQNIVTTSLFDTTSSIKRTLEISIEISHSYKIKPLV